MMDIPIVIEAFGILTALAFDSCIDVSGMHFLDHYNGSLQFG